ncbi:MAG: hypothetical protein DMF61_22835 [Blastocatellia bacterium AA13]|nr:MAG: hypothetical protein DMF61_22835 [Blastocatellia bacterium AA13]
MQNRSADKRKEKRIAYLCEVQCEGASVGSLNTRINDLSSSGLFIDSMTCFPVGSVLKLKFRIRENEISTSAEVRYCMPQIGMGVQFIDLTEEARALIEEVVEGKLKP